MPEIKSQITTGNLLQVAVTLCAVVAAFISVQHQASAAVEDITDHEGRIRVLESITQSQLARIDERLARIERGLK